MGFTNHFDMSIVYDISVFEISTFNWIHICTESIIYMYIYDKEVKGILKNCILQYLINSVVCTRNCRNSVKRILSMGNTFYTLCNNVICHLYLWDTIFSLLIWHLLVLGTNQTVDSVSLWILIHKYFESSSLKRINGYLIEPIDARNTLTKYIAKSLFEWF